jgi:glycosyltransferase involved in cell wall biosynthesis
VLKLSYIVILPVKDGEDHLSESIKSTLNQTVPPLRVFIIDDGSKDQTYQIAYGLTKDHSDVTLIHFDSEGRSYLRIPILYQMAVDECISRRLHPNYILCSSDDVIYPSSYVEQLLARMKADKTLKLASGDFMPIIVGEKAPQGTGRMIDYDYYMKVGGYPLNVYGWESWLLFKVLLDGYNMKCFQDMRFEHVRNYSSSSILTFGYAMYGLGYSPLMVALRFAVNIIRPTITLKQNFIMLYGWVSAHWKHFNRIDEEFRRQLCKKQHIRIKTILLRIIYKPFKSKKRPEKEEWCGPL